MKFDGFVKCCPVHFATIFTPPDKKQSKQEQIRGGGGTVSKTSIDDEDNNTNKHMRARGTETQMTMMCVNCNKLNKDKKKIKN